MFQTWRGLYVAKRQLLRAQYHSRQTLDRTGEIPSTISSHFVWFNGVVILIACLVVNY